MCSSDLTSDADVKLDINTLTSNQATVIIHLSNGTVIIHLNVLVSKDRLAYDLPCLL